MLINFLKLSIIGRTYEFFLVSPVFFSDSLAPIHFQSTILQCYVCVVWQVFYHKLLMFRSQRLNKGNLIKNPKGSEIEKNQAHNDPTTKFDEMKFEKAISRFVISQCRVS